MKKIINESKTHGAHEVLLDDEDYEWVSKEKWYLKRDHTVKKSLKLYVYRNLYSPGSRVPKPRILHREILKAPKGFTVDHINGNGLDNRKENIRLCSALENNLNRGPSHHNKTGFKGVFKEPRNPNRPWCATVCRRFGGKTKREHLGFYATPEEAALVYDKKAIEYHGEFVWLNFPNGPSQEILKVIEEGRMKAAMYKRRQYKRQVGIKTVKNTSGYIGVSYQKDKRMINELSKPWAARITCEEGKRKHLGMFATKEEAARAYDKKAVELHGEFAQLNFPEEWVNVMVGKG